MEQVKLKTIIRRPIEKEILGLVGGMGPLASAEFVNRIYQYASYEENEQKAPFLILVSDPSIPDRSTSFLKGEKEVIFNRLVELLDFLEQSGATKYIICCITIHYIVPLLPRHHRNKIISLIDVIVDNVLKSNEKHLFLSTVGTRNLDILQKHPRWHAIEEQIQYLTTADQEAVHQLIYKHLKKGENPLTIKEDLLAIIYKYGPTSIIVGCTEIHLLTKNNTEETSIFHPLNVIDPLDIIAREVAQNQFAKIEEDQSL